MQYRDDEVNADELEKRLDTKPPRLAGLGLPGRETVPMRIEEFEAANTRTEPERFNYGFDDRNLTRQHDAERGYPPGQRDNGGGNNPNRGNNDDRLAEAIFTMAKCMESKMNSKAESKNETIWGGGQKT